MNKKCTCNQGFLDTQKPVSRQRMIQDAHVWKQLFGAQDIRTSEVYLKLPQLPLALKVVWYTRTPSVYDVTNKAHLKPAALCIGAFDGLHLGHKALVEATIQDAKEKGIASIALTFDPDPSAILTPQAQEPMLLSAEDRAHGLLSWGLDAVVKISFTQEFADLSYQEFFEEVVAQLVEVRSVHVGINFALGVGGRGTPGILEKYLSTHDIAFCAHSLTVQNNQPVSATSIRKLIAQGKVDEAALFLGRSYSLTSVVEHGRHVGTTLGFPTANLSFAQGICLPAPGVYACSAQVCNTLWPAAVSVGVPPTFQDEFTNQNALVEAHLLGFDQSLYAQSITVFFYAYVRPMCAFDSREELIQAIENDKNWVQEHLPNVGLEVTDD